MQPKLYTSTSTELTHFNLSWSLSLQRFTNKLHMIKYQEYMGTSN